MKLPAVQLFSAKEYADRLRALQQRITARKLDVLLVHKPENIFYISGYQTPGYYWHQALIVPAGREPVFIPPPHEASLVPQFCWVEDVRLFPDTSDWAEVIANTLTDIGFGSGRIGLEAKSWFLTADLRDRIAARLPGATVSDGSGLVEAGRMIKSPRELDYMRQAARCSEAGMKAGIAAVRAGATELEVAAAAHTALDLAGSEYSGLPAFITSGPRSMLVHATWSPRVVQKSELVFLEIPGVVNRYHAAHTRSVFTGEPPDLLLRADETGRAALQAAKAAMRPGTAGRDVFQAGKRVIDEADIGYKQGRRLAYGIGIAFPPGWDEGDIFSLNSDEPRQLQAGMTFHVIATMRLQELGAVGCSDTVLVTGKGAETLTTAVPPSVLVKRS
jgi:Xaa-Pro dipeptidase